MRILHIVESLAFGGAEKVIVDLANTAAERHQVGVCCVRKAGELARHLHPGVTLHCLEGREGNDYRVPFRMASYFRSFRPDVVHLHNWGSFLETGLAALLSPGVALVQTVHGPYLEYGSQWRAKLKKFWRRRLERLLAKRYGAIVGVASTVTAYIRDDMRLGATLLTIHNGIGVNPLPPQAQLAAPLHRPAGAVLFITVARLAPIKNQALMLRAFQTVSKSLSEVRLWIVGDGPERSNLDKLVDELGIGHAVTFHGYREDVARLLEQADMFLLSSTYEGISISILEAMRAGLPVIASNVGGIPETIEHGVSGWLFEAANPQAMASAMEKLARDAELRGDMGRAARQRLLDSFSMAAMLESYETLYHQTIQRNPGTA